MTMIKTYFICTVEALVLIGGFSVAAVVVDSLIQPTAKIASMLVPIRTTDHSLIFSESITDPKYKDYLGPHKDPLNLAKKAKEKKK